MGLPLTEPKTGGEFFASSLIGEKIAQLSSEGGKIMIRFESGLRAIVKRSYRTDLAGERIVGFEFQFPSNRKAVTFLFASGSRAVMEL